MSANAESLGQGSATSLANKKLFICCFAALVATSFGFILRVFAIDDWAAAFNLTETQKGEIFGVGLWPFAISIVLFSLVIDRIGYRTALIFAFVCHVLSAVLTITANGYWSLYLGTFIVAIANGTVEAVINPVIATAFRKEKTKWLNMLHAGWPAGLMIGGILAIGMGAGVSWKFKIALILIPTLVYGVLMLGVKFPINERVAAGVPYKTMLKEVGALGTAIITWMIVWEVGRVFNFPVALKWALVLAVVGGYGAYTRSLGRPLLVFLFIVMIPLATTELGTDSWITSLVAPEVGKMGLNPGWVLVLTSLVMMLLRFVAGPIVHKLSPLGLLAAAAAIAAVGLGALSMATGVAIFAAAIIYALGKTFFWPTMLGVVAEQFPKGGALTLNAMGGVGMLAAGVVGAQLLGGIQDHAIDRGLQSYDEAHNTQLHSSITVEKEGTFGSYRAVNQTALASANPATVAAVDEATGAAKKEALRTVALFPLFLLVSFGGLVLYFKSRGGYRAVELETLAVERPAGAPVSARAADVSSPVST
ncbi:MAG: MFS transporter [Deltaproteobacteria bacterium]|nr:MFS transporter [Deltaproteobacteria bacterium]